MAEERTGELYGKIIDAKIDDWGEKNYIKHNFRTNNELMVEITLSEYRSLILTKGSHDTEINKKDEELREQRAKVYELEKKVKELTNAFVSGIGKNKEDKGKEEEESLNE